MTLSGRLLSAVCLVSGLGLVRLGAARAQTPEPQSTTGDSAAQAQLTYERTWPEQKVPFFRITVHPDGSGSYSTLARQGTPTPAESTSDPAPTTDPPSQQLHISERNRARIFAVASVVRSPKGCESGNRHTAQTGRKFFSLEGDGPAAQCTFNFSDDHRVEDAVSILNGVALTLEEGNRIHYLLRFDRLGLDAALGSLLEDVQTGRALEVENIAPLLNKLQADDALMTRVRERAMKLLDLGSGAN